MNLFNFVLLAAFVDSMTRKFPIHVVIAAVLGNLILVYVWIAKKNFILAVLVAWTVMFPIYFFGDMIWGTWRMSGYSMIKDWEN